MKNPFSVLLGNIALVTVLCIAISLYHGVGSIILAFSVTIGWLFYGKLAIAMSFNQGYGVKGVRTIAGMPVLLAIFVTLIGAAITHLLVTAYQPTTLLQPTTMINLRSIGWSAAIGVGTAVLFWYACGQQWYFYESVYNIRKECRARGDSPKETEAAVAMHRANGTVQ